MGAEQLLRGRKVLLVTRHGKERVITPALENEFGMKINVADKIDTDQFGTFSGDVERSDTLYKTARLKVSKAFDLYPHADIAIASEGPFYPHPDSPFLPVNTELVLLLDKKNGLEISGRYVSLAAMVKERTVSSLKEALNFAKVILFPEYGIALKVQSSKDYKPFIFKGARTWSSLETALHFLFTVSFNGKIQLQSDMRANFNPFRMENILLATLKLVKTMNRTCQKCCIPGFDVIEVVKGLPCAHCKAPTKTTLSHIYKCKNCNYREEIFFPHGKKHEDPGSCDYCNP